jgi:plasmid maintenance system antidote protein VapI
MARKKTNNMVAVLRDAMVRHEQSLYGIAKSSGVEYSALLRFRAGERGLTLETAAKLADYLGLELRPRQKGG